MTFTPIAKATNYRVGRGPAAPTVTLAKYRGLATQIRLNRAIVEQLGWPASQPVSIGIGSGADDGWLEIAPTANANAYRLAAVGDKKNGAMIIRAKSLYPNAPIVATTVAKHTIANGKLYISVPSVFRSAEVKPWTPAVSHNAWVAAE